MSYFGINERPGGGVGLVRATTLAMSWEVVVVFHFDLMVERRQRGRKEARVHTHTHTTHTEPAEPGPPGLSRRHTQRQTWVPHLLGGPHS